jgi:predicted metalloendopeptidase
LVEIFGDAPPQIKRNLETLLKGIESNIPLNQLYVDLTSDKPAENETETTMQEVEEILKGLFEQMTTPRTKSELLERLAVTDPFVNYPQLITHYRGEITNDGD